MSMQGGAGAGRDLAWLLDDLADRVEDFRKAVILSRDGLVVAASRDLSREDAEHLSALAAAVQSWPGARETASASARSGRPSSNWSRRCSSSPRPVKVAAWPHSALPTPTPASSPMRWRCW